MSRIAAGDRVVIMDALGDEHEVEALSGIESAHPHGSIVFVHRPLTAGGFDIMPWPADAVRLPDEQWPRDRGGSLP